MGAAASIDSVWKEELGKTRDASDISSMEMGKEEIAHLRVHLAQNQNSLGIITADVSSDGNQAPNNSDFKTEVHFLNQTLPKKDKPKMTYFSDPVAYFDEFLKDGSDLPAGDVYIWGSGRENIGVPKDKEHTCALATKVRGVANIIQVDCGENCTAAITRNGELYTWGDTRGGRLGHMQSNEIGQVGGEIRSKKVVAVAAGQSHMACITTEGHVYTWGKGNNGALGDGDCSMHERSDPGIVCFPDGDLLEDVTFIDCSNENTAAVQRGGKLYIWGSGKHGKMGDGRKKSRPYPQLITSIPPIKQVSLGSLYTGAVTKEGELYTWGYGKAGNLGHGNRRSCNLPMKVMALQDIPISSVHCTKNQANPLTEGDLEGKENPHTLIVAGDGSLYTCGPCHKGFLGNMKNKGLSQPGCDQLSPYKVGSTFSDAPDEGESHYLENICVIQGIATKIHSGCVGDDGCVYTFGCASSGRMGVLKFMEGLHGGRSRMKCYIPNPTKVVQKGKKPLTGVFQISSSARHMAAIVQKVPKSHGGLMIEGDRQNKSWNNDGGKLHEG